MEGFYKIEKLKRIISILLIASMIFTTNGMSVFAENVDTLVFAVNESADAGNTSNNNGNTNDGNASNNNGNTNAGNTSNNDDVFNNVGNVFNNNVGDALQASRNNATKIDSDDDDEEGYEDIPEEIIDIDDPAGNDPTGNNPDGNGTDGNGNDGNGNDGNGTNNDGNDPDNNNAGDAFNNNVGDAFYASRSDATKADGDKNGDDTTTSTENIGDTTTGYADEPEEDAQDKNVGDTSNGNADGTSNENDDDNIVDLDSDGNDNNATRSEATDDSTDEEEVVVEKIEEASTSIIEELTFDLFEKNDEIASVSTIVELDDEIIGTLSEIKPVLLGDEDCYILPEEWHGGSIRLLIFLLLHI